MNDIISGYDAVRRPFLLSYWLACMVFVAGIAAPASSMAQEVRITNGGGGFACLSESSWDELTKAVVAKDMKWAQSMMADGECFLMKAGLSATLKDYSMWGTSQLYLKPPGGGRPIVVWTANENFK